MNLLICSNYTTIFLQTDFLRQGEGRPGEEARGGEEGGRQATRREGGDEEAPKNKSSYFRKLLIKEF